ncbi:MAG: hypothetical protein HXX11_07070 [Desulfuromonadales bacterium]|nr:hypothetical protein [Desulfuromonadales bacterium]
MKWRIHSAGTLLLLLVFSSVSHASGQKSESLTPGAKYLSQASAEKNAMNEAIKVYLERNPPEVISKSIYATVEKAQPASVPAYAREKVLSLLKENITPEIMAKMISAGLKRNFTVAEIEVLSKYDESQLSDDLKKKNEIFKFQVSSEIGLLLAASSG